MRKPIAKDKRLVATVASLLMVPAWVSAQNADHHYRGQGYWVFGLGTGTSHGQRPFFKHVAAGGEGFLYQGLGFGAELGYATW